MERVVHVKYALVIKCCNRAFISNDQITNKVASLAAKGCVLPHTDIQDSEKERKKSIHWEKKVLEDFCVCVAYTGHNTSFCRYC